MNRIKVMCLILATAMMMSVAACNRAEESKTTTAETTETTTAETTAVTATEESVTEATVTEETIPEEVVFSNDEIFTELRNYASTLHEDENDTKLYGFDTYFPDGESSMVSLLAVYDGEIKFYQYDESGVTPCLLDYDYGVMNPETDLLPYDVFMELPGMVSCYGVGNVADWNEVSIPDGRCGGTLFGFSADGKYLYGIVGLMPTFDLSAEQCLNLKEGDKVTVDTLGECEVIYIVEQSSTAIMIGLKDCDAVIEEGAEELCGFIVVILNEDGNPIETTFQSQFGYNYYADDRYVKIPVADDLKIVDADGIPYEGDLLTFLEEQAASDSNLIKYEGSGYAYTDSYFTWGLNSETTFNIIENGELKVLVY